MAFLLGALDSRWGGRLVHGGLISGFLADLGREGSKRKRNFGITSLDVADAGNANSHHLLLIFQIMKYSTYQAFNERIL